MPPAVRSRNETRLVGADAVRAVACLMVFAHHWLQRLNPAALPDSFRPLYHFGIQGAFGVAAFFVLSGYLLSGPFWQARDRGAPMPSLRTYALRRLARIAPGYWMALTVSFVASITIFGEEANRSLVSRFFSGFLFLSDWHWKTFFPVDCNGPLWSISFEVTSYILLPFGIALLFLLPAQAKWAARGTWLVVLCAVLLLHTLIVTYLPIDRSFTGWENGLLGGANFWMPRFNPIGFFAIFAVGVLAAGIQVRLATRRGGYFDLAAVAGVIVAALALLTSIPSPDAFGLASLPYSFPWFALGVAIILIASPSSIWFGRLADNRVAIFIARISFGIYVWHVLIIEVMRQQFFPRLFKGGITNLTEWVALAAVSLALSIAVATASFYWLERPITRWARRFEVDAREDAPCGRTEPSKIVRARPSEEGVAYVMSPETRRDTATRN